MTRSLDEAARSCRVLVTVGAGGVGKTTTAAVLAMQAAQAGRRALVMTIDPARRLASALGIRELDHELRRVDLSGLATPSSGEMWASMLDMKRTFDGIVDRYAPDRVTRDRILDNRFYHHFSSSLAGSQELSASERLFEVVESGRFDLVVLDTPPTSNALDFLDAPVRFFDALDSSAIQWIVAATGFAHGRGILGLSTQFFLKTLGRFTGQDFFKDLGEFLHHFSGLLDGIRARSEATQRLFRDQGTQFVLVTSPDPATATEALEFRARLAERGVAVAAVVVNRTHARFDDNAFTGRPVGALTDALERVEGARIHGRPTLARLARLLLENARAWNTLAGRDDATIEALRAALPGVPILRVPTYASDVHGLDGLDAMRGDLFTRAARS